MKKHFCGFITCREVMKPQFCNAFFGMKGIASDMQSSIFCIQSNAPNMQDDVFAPLLRKM